MKALDRKLLRDLAQMRSQIVTIALVIASAVAGFVGTLSTYTSLELARQSFYEDARFAHVFGSLKRAPDALGARLAQIPGAADVQTTVVFDATLDLPGAAEPVIGRIIGLPAGGERRLNRVSVRRGRMIDAARPHEVVVSEAFAAARNLHAGDRVTVILNGRREILQVVGEGLAPDYVYGTRGGAFPDDRNFGVFWMDREQLAAAFDMQGAFNDVAVWLAPNASERAVIDALDRLLTPYGGANAYGRAEQVSNRILEQEIGQWKAIASILPTVFLAVAAFLLNVVLSRQITTQREQIAALKALGYGNGSIAAHYLKQVLVIVALGAAIGIALGYWMCRELTALYALYFHFPHYTARLPAWIILFALAVTLAAAVAAALGAVRRAVILAPAEAMRPPAPGRYRPLLIERLGLRSRFGPAASMVMRELERRPLRALLTACGIASALAIIIVGRFWADALDYIVSVQFEAAQRADAEIELVGPAVARVRHAFAQMPGVRQVEAGRSVAARLVFGHRFYRTALVGIPRGGELRRLLDADLHVVPLPPTGVLLSEQLAQRLGVVAGDSLTLELLEGDRAHHDVPVAGTVRDFIGLFAYMDAAALNRLMGEGDVVNAVSVATDRAGTDAFFAGLRAVPRVATAASKRAMLKNFSDFSARNILVFTGILTVFAAIIATGVVYNHARIALAERAWELASLRVLGFTRLEVSALLLNQLAIEIAMAIPIGCLLGYALSWLVVRLTHTDMIVIPVIVAPRTYALAALAIVAAGAVSALIVRRRVDRLDLVGVLKTRE